jgi:hypothetical protein
MALKINDKDPVKQAMAVAKLKVVVMDNCPAELDGYITTIRFSQVILELQAKLEAAEDARRATDTQNMGSP